MKKERLIRGELEQNADILYPLVDSMLESRQKHVIEMNEKFDQNISVDFGSVWKKRKVEKQITTGEYVPLGELEETESTVSELKEYIQELEDYFEELESGGEKENDEEPEEEQDNV